MFSNLNAVKFWKARIKTLLDRRTPFLKGKSYSFLKGRHYEDFSRSLVKIILILENIIISGSQMKYYEEENSAAMSEDDNDDNVDIESDVSFAKRLNHFFFQNSIIFYLCVFFFVTIKRMMI
jgi:hypothetical protein